jgi:succinoglycan biosynthesis transport protein ExoP
LSLIGGISVDTNVNSTYPEEISLRELIETLIKGWKLIVAITLLAVLISAVVSFFLIEPTYEASVTLMASAAAKVEAPRTGTGISGFLDAMADIPTPTLDTYREQVKNVMVLQNVLDDLGLGPDRLTRRALSSKVSVEIVNNTNLIRIKVRDGDPKLAADLADSLAENFTGYVSDLAKEQALTSYMYLEKQMNVEKDMLDRALTAYKEFLAQPRGVQELQAEIDSRLLFVTDFTMQYMQKEVEEKAKKAALETLQQELAQTEKILVTKKSLSEDAFLNNVISEATGQSTLQTGQVMMENQEINPNYLALENSISILRSELAMLASERQNIKSQIDQNSAELERLQAELAEKQHQENILKRNIELAQQTYDAFYSKYEEIRITQSGQVGEASIVVTSPASVPLVPVSPNRRLNVAIAGVLGLMVSVFVVFIKDYWEKTGQEGSLK